ncbi:hypothetical protein ACHAXT_004144 [Thalassiosira profunda]
MTRSSRRTSARSAASENDDDAEGSGRGRRSSRARNQTAFFAENADEAGSDRDDESDEDASEGTEGSESEEEEAMPARRKSSRATAFKGGMKDPSNSIADLLKTADEPAGGGGSKKRRGARVARSSLEGNGSDDDMDEDDDVYASPKKKKAARKGVVKSPAKRHSSRRMSKKLEYREPESSDEESSDEEEVEVDSDAEEEEEIKLSKVIACQSLTLKEWKEVCAKMNTSEITNGSRWIQGEDEAEPVDEEKYEERFLCKWDDMSFLHCSWETEKDLVNLCDGAKTRLSTFFRKAEGGFLYEPDERLDGDYFDPSWTTIERIMEVKDVEVEDGEEAPEIIVDVNDPNFDAGAGPQFFIKWVNKPYTDSSYEFERDLILNEVDYKEHLDSFNKRKVKPTREDMRRRDKESDVQQRKLYKIFGDKIKQSDEAKEEQVQEYQKELENRVFQPVGGQLRDYQAEGVSWLMSNHLNKRSSILADEMGLGKTIQTATYVYTVSQQLRTRGPFLIVAPLSTIPHWYREFTGWTDLNTIVYHGSANDRELAREEEFPFPEDQVQNVAFNQRYLNKVAKRWKSKWEKTWMVEVVITTPEMLVTDDFAELAAVKWEIMVVDEAHRLKNHNSKLAQNLRDDRFDFNHSLLLTGTPIQNNMQELWTLLNFINPDTFDDLDEFLEDYGDIKSKEKVDELHETIRPYILRRLKEDVEKSGKSFLHIIYSLVSMLVRTTVPPKEETLIEVELTVLQKQYYRALYEKNLKFLHRNKKKPLDGPSINNLAMQLRKCCNHPFLLTGVETEVRAQNPNTDDVESMVNASGKFVLLDKLLPRMKADGHRILLFSQFKIMLDIIEDYLHLRNFKCERIDGSITGLKRQAAIDRFQSKESATNGREQPFIMLLSTRAGGVGINLTAADTCIIFDSDWNPQNDLQAQARCHRIGQTKNVKIYRLLTRKTYEMQMFHMSSMKMGLDQAVLQGIENTDGKDIMTKEEVEKLLKHGAYDIFAEDKDGTSEKESNDFVSQDIDSILARRAKTVVHENTGSNSAAAGGTFSKASFKNTNSEGVDTEEVDVDDPDFWTKVVGEVKEQEQAVELGKRKRDKPQYSEKETWKQLDREIRFGVDGGSGAEEAANDESSSDEYSDSGGESDDEYLNLDNAAMKIISKATKSKKKDERYRWGGSGASEWKQSDADAVMKAIQAYGYGNISWEKFNAYLPLSKTMKPQEVKRMAWSLVLLTLYETAEDAALESTRKAEAAAASKEKQPEGDVLARTGVAGGNEAEKEDVIMEDADKGPDEAEEKTEEGKVADSVTEPSKSPSEPEEEKDPLEVKFKELLSENKSWVELALADALAFSKTAAATPRDKKYVQSIVDGLRPTKGAVEENAYQIELTTKFNENIWPGLRSRGWKNDEKKKAKGYTYKDKTFKSILSVIDAIPKYHPELMVMANSLITSLAASCKDAASAPVATLDPATLTAKSLKSFLMDCAPLQLLVDRKSAHRVHLPKKLIGRLTLVCGLHKFVADADANMPSEATPDEGNVQLSQLITISPRIAKPHPEWTLVHDAILIRAVIKHGWIDKLAASAAVAKDKTIRWGAPFEAMSDPDKEKKKEQEDPEAEKKFQADYDRLSKTASRAATFLQKLNASFAEGLPPAVLNDLSDRLIKTYGIVKSTDDNESVTWTVDEEELKKILRPPKAEAGDNCEDLPSQKALLKRIRRLGNAVIGKGSAPEEEKEETQDNAEKNAKVEAKSYGYHVIDQSDRNNILLAEMIRGQLFTKQAVKIGIVKDYSALVVDEITALKDVAKAAEIDATVQALRKTKKDIQLYLNTFRKTPRASKNILRVMMGIDPVHAKVETEPLFASEAEKTSSTTASAKAALTKLKKKKGFTNADSALNRALASFVEDKDGIKDCLLLTSTEVLMLTVMASQGLPVFSDDWKSLVTMAEDNGEEEDDDEFTIYFAASAGIMEAAAQVWKSVAETKLRTERQRHADVSAIPEKDKAKLSVLQKDSEFKAKTLEEATAYMKEPLEFAKRCIMLVEAVRKNMGPVDLSYAGEKKTRQLNKSENGLGTKVLNWMSKDLRRWAGPLCATDDDGNVLSTTSITKKKDHPQSHDAAMMTKRDCRTVYIQIAQQTRLRSIFSKNKVNRLSDELIPKVLSQSTFAMTEWDDRPAWWNEERMDDSDCSCQDDLDLLHGILEYGYGGFESLLQQDFPFCKRIAAQGSGEKKLTRSSVQIRVNHLTRELHALDETEEMMKLVAKKKSSDHKTSSSGKAKKSKTGGGIQSGLQAFFKKASTNPGSKKQKTTSGKSTPPTSPEGETSDVEIIEIDADSGSGKKRKIAAAFDQVELQK